MMMYLSETGSPVLMQLANSRTAVAENVQQLPQLPWSLTGCMQLSLR